MQSTLSVPIEALPLDLASMLATISSFENCFGPYHARTLNLLTQAGRAFWQAGEADYARLMLERAVRDWARLHSPKHEVRLEALAILIEVLDSQGVHDRMLALLQELLEYQIQSLGGDHENTRASRLRLARLLMERSHENSLKARLD